MNAFLPSEHDIAKLARLTLDHQNGRTVYRGDVLDGLRAALYRDTYDRLLELPGRDEVTADDDLAGLRLLREEREHLDRFERHLIEHAKDQGVSWEQLGVEGFDRSSVGQTLSPRAVQQRYRRLGGKRSWPK